MWTRRWVQIRRGHGTPCPYKVNGTIRQTDYRNDSDNRPRIQIRGFETDSWNSPCIPLATQLLRALYPWRLIAVFNQELYSRKSVAMAGWFGKPYRPKNWRVKMAEVGEGKWIVRLFQPDAWDRVPRRWRLWILRCAGIKIRRAYVSLFQGFIFSPEYQEFIPVFPALQVL